MSTASAMLDRYVATHDDTRANGLLRLNERYARMVVEAQWLQKEGSIGTTVADTAEYAISSGIEDIRSVFIDGERYFPVSMEDLAALEDDDAGVSSSYPVFAEQYNSSGALYIRLWPTPSTSGDTITALTSGQPTALTDTTDAAGTPSIPEDLHPRLYDGLNADGYLFSGERPDMAAIFDQRFEEGIKLLKRRRNSRFGSGATVMQVSSGGF